MRIPPSVVEKIYQAADIVEVVSDYVSLKKKGAGYWGLSPFKVEKTASFTVSPAKKIYKCFSTGKGGGVVDFLMEVEGFTYKEALLHLAHKYKIAVELHPEQNADEDRKESLFSLNKFATKFFQSQLTSAPFARAYFQKRGFTAETIDAFQLGFAPNEWAAFTDYALHNQYRREQLVSTGLSFVSEKNDRLLDRFRGRVMFPLIDALGKVAGFAGRILEPDPKAAKYVNSPESEIYHKSRILYGLFQARLAIREKDECLLVEGYTDVISLYQAGVKNVVASGGTALTEEQIKLIRRHTRNVLVLYDGDEAGVKASLRGVDLLLANDLRVRVLPLPADQDPDSFIREKGADAFRAYVAEKARDFIQFKVEALSGDYQSLDPAKRADVIAEVAHSLSKITDPVLRETYSQYAAETLRVPEPVLFNAVRLAERAQAPSPAPRPVQTDFGTTVTPTVAAPVASVEALGKFYFQERELLRLLLNYPMDSVIIDEEPTSLVDFLFQELGESSFEHAVFEILRAAIFEIYVESGVFSPQTLLERFAGDKSVQPIVSELLSEPYHLSENWAKRDIIVRALDFDLSQSAQDAMTHYQLKAFKKLQAEARAKLKDCTEPSEQDKWLKRVIKLDKLSKPLNETKGVVVSY